MLPIQYAYLFGIIILLIPWTILFWHRKDLRKEMIVMSLIAGVGSFFTAYFWTIDWWSPLTISGTRIGVEDFLLGISGGIAAVLYEEIFRKRLYKRDKLKHSKGLLEILIISSIIFLFAFYILNLSTSIACFLAMIFFIGIVGYLRKDIVISSIVNGFIFTAIVLPIYLVLILLFVDFINITYPYPLSGISFLSIPIEELYFWFLFGILISLFYEYWMGLKLRNIPVVGKSRK